MVIVDTCVWIDHFRNSPTPQVLKLRAMLRDANAVVLAADLVMVEILQGSRSTAQFDYANETLSILPTIGISNSEVAIQAA
jgi:predicted nucleic acid-binding protein